MDEDLRERGVSARHLAGGLARGAVGAAEGKQREKRVFPLSSFFEVTVR